MFQRSIWMRPALQTSEAVLLPALNRRQMAEPGFSDRYARPKSSADVFRPVQTEGVEAPQLALSTYVRSRGSMAGRSVLRAAGVTGEPFSSRGKPQYYAGKVKRTSKRELGYEAWLPARVPPERSGYR